MTGPILEVSGLHVALPGVDAVRGVSFTLDPGETVALVGASGAGKSLTAKAILGLLPRSARTLGTAAVGGVDVLKTNRAVLRGLRGGTLGYVPQDALTVLSPVHRVGDQIAAAIASVQGLDRAAAQRAAIAALDTVGIPDPVRRSRDHPHQFSGGMRQRAVIALATVNAPKLIVADEPTTALDVRTGRQVLDLLRERCAATEAGLLIITHDLNVVEEYADRVLAMADGRLLADAAPQRTVVQPRSPVADGHPLLEVDDLTVEYHMSHGTWHRLATRIRPRRPGPKPPTGTNQIAEPPATRTPHLGKPFTDQTGQAAPTLVPESQTAGPRAAQTGRTHHLGKPLTAQTGEATLTLVPESRAAGPRGTHRAVDGVSFRIAAGETLALIGPSGSGKSSTAAAVLRLVEPSGGTVRFEGRDLTGLSERDLRALRPKFQPVLQDPYGSLSPRLTAGEAVAEPLRVQHRWDPATGLARVRELFALTGLDSELAERRPHELSGGQCQRVNIARALASEPRLLVLDEPTSALDAHLRQEIFDLLIGLQERLRLGYLFICHDLEAVRGFAHRVAVMEAGRIVKTGSVEEVCADAVA